MSISWTTSDNQGMEKGIALKSLPCFFLRLGGDSLDLRSIEDICGLAGHDLDLYGSTTR